MDKSRCAGCRNDFYNGNNQIGVTECWHLLTAIVVPRKRVHVNQMPPWNQEAEQFPSCYEEIGYVFVKPNVKN